MPERALVDARALRAAMGHFATGVTVVTHVHHDVHGMTANAFMSVSLAPPLVVVSLNGDSTMASRLRDDDAYGVSVLAESQEPLADHFAGRARLATAPLFEWVNGVAVIPAALVNLTARVVDRHPAGDHVLFIGAVDRVVTRPGEPLIFHRGVLRGVTRHTGGECSCDQVMRTRAHR